MAHIVGTNGNDSLVGTSGVDTIEGLAGNDTLVGLAGNDSLLGGLGDDRYVVGTGDILSDSGGTDTVESSVSWTLGAGFENLTFTGTAVTSGSGNNLNNVITGSAGNNWLRGLEGNDTINAGAGNDTIQMSNGSGSNYGNDVINGGDGVDTLDYGTAARTGLTVDLQAGTASGGGLDGGGSATLVSVENVNGSAFNDTISGNSAANFLFGFDGHDVLDGRTGNDRLEGGAGNDWYVFTTAAGSANADTVVGFASGFDDIVLDGSVYANTGGNGEFTAGDSRFAAGAGFNSGQDASDRVIYNTTTGQLWYDADGNGAGAAQLIATLQGAPAFAATDVIIQGASSGSVINGTEGDDTLNGTGSNDTLNGFGGNDSLWGSEGADILNAGDGNDTLDGLFHSFAGSEADVDTLNGGQGNDYFMVDNDADVLVDAGGIDTIEAFNRDWTLAAGFENLVLNTDQTEGGNTGFGNELDNHMRITWAGALEGGGGNDTLVGGRSAFANDTLSGGDGDDLLLGTYGDVLNGGAGNDTLTGVFEGFMTGGAGADHFGLDVNLQITDFTTGADKLTLDGNLFDNTGPSGHFAVNDERFHSGAGVTDAHDSSDRLIYDSTTGRLYYDSDGAGGIDAYFFARLEGAPTLVASDIEVVNSSGNHVDGTASNDSIVGSEGDDTINALGGNDTLDGRAGNDVLIGGPGIDSMLGGPGDDIYFVDNASDAVVEQQDEGVDEVLSALTSYTLPAWVENLLLIDGGANGTGNDLDNWLAGNGSNNRLEGGTGDDSIYGFNPRQSGGFYQGNDTLIGGEGNDLIFGLYGHDLIDGGAGNDTLWGNAGVDTILGGAGDDELHLEFDGNDSVDGGEGIDTLFSQAAAQHTVNLQAGTLTTNGGTTATILNLENVVLLNNHDSVIGSSVANRIDLGAGDDTASGGGGRDTLIGGDGADSFLFDTAPGATNWDRVPGFESGIDKIRLDGRVMTELGASGDFAPGDARFASGPGFISGRDADDRVIHNTSTGELWYDPDGSGSGVAETIAILGEGLTLAATDIAVDNGSAPTGGQTINGTANNDTLVGGAGNDTINGNAGADLIQGQGGNDSLVGSTGWDTIQGGDGNDWLHGGGWSDTMTGGAGSDSFVWNDSGNNTRDTVTDFVSGTDELLFDNAAMTALGANGAWAAGDGRFWAAAGATAGHDADDRLVYNTSNGNLYYDADGSGAGAAQVVATFQGGVSISASDITVI